MIEPITFGVSANKNYPYGNVQRVGNSGNGRVLYRVIDSQGKEAGSLTIPQEEVDTFEAACKDVMETAPKIQKYVKENSSDEDIKRRRNLSRAIVGVGGLLGAAIPLAITRKSSSIPKRVLSAVGGIILGISAGYGVSVAALTPPGTYKFAKANRTFTRLDIQQVVE